MQEYDVAFKRTVMDMDLAIRSLTGGAIATWLNVELPDVRNRRVDLLGETADGGLVQIELQSTNDSSIPVRMGLYYLMIFELLHRFPKQIVLYLGDKPLNMPAGLVSPDMHHRYRVIDVRELGGEELLESPMVGDNVVAVLAGLPDMRAAIRRVVDRIARLHPEKRGRMLRQFLILAGLRKLGSMVEEEAQKMPILNDILEHEVLGREYKKGREEGREEGVQLGELTILRRLIAQRFGPIPAWAERRLAKLGPSELEALSLRFLQVSTLKDLLH